MRGLFSRLEAFARTRWRLGVDLLIGYGVFLVCYRLMLPYMNPSLWGMRGKQHFWGDEGTVLHHAERIRHGEVLYRDFFDFQGFFGFLPFTAAFAIGPATPTTGRFVMIVLMALWCAILFVTVRVITEKRWAGVLVALYFALCVWPTFPYAYQHFIADLWVTCALLFAVWGERETLRTGWLVAGIFAALALWTSVSEGGVAIVSMGVTCLLFRYARRGGWKLFFQYVEGLCWVTTLYGIYLLGTRSLQVAITDILVFPFKTYGLANATQYAFDGPEYVNNWRTGPYAKTVERLVDMTGSVPKWGIYLALATSLLLLDRVAHRFYTGHLKARGTSWPKLSATVLAASVGALAVPVVMGTTRNDICHLGFVQETAVLAMLVVWAPISRASLKKLRWKLVWVLQLACAVPVVQILYDSWQFEQHLAKTAAAATVRDLTEDAVAHYNCKAMRARTRPEDSVVIHYGGMGYLACERRSAISFPHLFHGPYWQDQWPQAAREIALRKPRVMFISGQDFDRLASDQPILRSLYFGVESGSYVLAQGRPGPPVLPGTWAYSLTGPGGRVTRGTLKLERTAGGLAPYRARLDDGEKTLGVHVDGAMVQIFDGPAVYALERDASGAKMSGLFFEGATRIRQFDAQIEAGPP